MWTYASRMHDLRGPLYASESWLHVSWLHHKTFNLSLLFVSSQWRASHTWPCLDEAIGQISRGISPSEAMYAQQTNVQIKNILLCIYAKGWFFKPDIRTLFPIYMF